MSSPSPTSSAGEVAVRPSTRRRLLRTALGLTALSLLVWGVLAQRTEIVNALREFSGITLLSSAIMVLAGLLASMLSWRQALAGLGSKLSIRASTRIYFMAQLGKYIPGSVWPMLAQVELGRDHGVPRVRSGVASIASLVVGLVVGTVVGVIGLVAGTSDGLRAYVWVLFVIPIGLAFLWPAVLQRIIAMALRLVRRPQTQQQIDAGGLIGSASWSLLMWVLFGVQAWFLARDLGASDDRLFLQCCGAYAISWIVGFLVFFAPAGVGPREAALVVTLAAVLPRPDALALALISRALMLLGDLIFVGVAWILGRTQRGD